MYSGPATLQNDGQDPIAIYCEVVVSEDARTGLGEWAAYATMDERAMLAVDFNTDSYTLVLDDGRRGQVFMTDFRMPAGTARLTGTGAPPS